jgi:hypothetical protein
MLSAYNFGMRFDSHLTFCLAFLLSAVWARSQSAEPVAPLSITTPEALPAGELWKPYKLPLESTDGAGKPHHWRIIGGSLPRKLELNDLGQLSGTPEETGQFEFTVRVNDNDSPPNRIKKKLVLAIATPLAAQWEHKVRVNGNRIDGSVKISNHTGRDFDLTFIVLAVNDIGRATEIGYQHYPLKQSTRDMEIPFGDTLSPGNYAVNVDVVGEEPVSNRIFRARLVTGKHAVTQGP